jgi:hypothetical protein
MDAIGRPQPKLPHDESSRYNDLASDVLACVEQLRSIIKPVEKSHLRKPRFQFRSRRRSTSTLLPQVQFWFSKCKTNIEAVHANLIAQCKSQAPGSPETSALMEEELLNFLHR